MWPQVPGSCVWVLETWLLPAPIVFEGALYSLGSVERGGVDESRRLLCVVHVDAVDLLVLDVEELEFVNELPVSAQMSIGCGAES